MFAYVKTSSYICTVESLAETLIFYPKYILEFKYKTVNSNGLFVFIDRLESEKHIILLYLHANF